MKEFEGKSLDIYWYWAVSNLFCLSRLESIFITHPDPIVETIENSLSLFRNPFSFLREIIGFRHYFGDLYYQNKMAATYLLFFLISFYKNTKNWFFCDTLLIERVLPIPTNCTFFSTCSNFHLSIYMDIFTKLVQPLDCH